MGYKTYTCPIAKTCGGCEWLAVPYPIQLRRKREAVEELFADVVAEGKSAETRRRISVVGMDGNAARVMAELGVDVGSTTTAAGAAPTEPIHYRHKAATPFAPGAHGIVRCGFYAQGTHQIVPCSSCLVEVPRARVALAATARSAEELHLPAYEEDRGRGLLRHAVVRVGFATDECLLSVVVNERNRSWENEFVSRIRTHAPFVTAIALNVNRRRTNAILGRETHALLGAGRMSDQLLGCSFEIGATSFYQTNPAQTERLYALAIAGAQLEPGMRVLDAYCGIGTIGLCAAHQVENLEIVGIEQGEGAVADARINATRNGLGQRCRFIRADATAYLGDAHHARTHFDVVLMDPPRAGATMAFLRGIARIAPQRIVYVSCNPMTQRRDVDQLLASGYCLESLTLVDMFAHTKHAETIAILRRR